MVVACTSIKSIYQSVCLSIDMMFSDHMSDKPQTSHVLLLTYFLDRTISIMVVL